MSDLSVLIVDAIRSATNALDEIRVTSHAIAVHRRVAIRMLRERGWTLQQIGDAIGVSRQQVHRLLKASA